MRDLSPMKTILMSALLGTLGCKTTSPESSVKVAAEKGTGGSSSVDLSSIGTALPRQPGIFGGFTRPVHATIQGFGLSGFASHWFAGGVDLGLSGGSLNSPSIPEGGLACKLEAEIKLTDDALAASNPWTVKSYSYGINNDTRSNSSSLILYLDTGTTGVFMIPCWFGAADSRPTFSLNDVMSAFNGSSESHSVQFLINK